MAKKSKGEKKKQDRQSRLHESMGVRYVSQIVREKFECRWQEYEHRNDHGIDGQIILLKRGREIGVNINVQIKCGSSYLSNPKSSDENLHIKFKSKENLLQHKEYWDTRVDPVIIIFVKPDQSSTLDKIKKKIFTEVENISDKLKSDNILRVITEEFKKIITMVPSAWWVNLKLSEVYPDEMDTILKIPKKNQFDENSKGEIMKLATPYLNVRKYPIVNLNSENYRYITGGNFKKESRRFFKSIITVEYQPLNTKVQFNRVGWRHINYKRRKIQRRLNSYRHLGAIEPILEQVREFKVLESSVDRLSNGHTLVKRKIGIRANLYSKDTTPVLVQLILLNKRIYNGDDIVEQKTWFYSIYELTRK